VYECLLNSDPRAQALEYITPGYRSAQVVDAVEADATQLREEVRFTATATGGTVVFQAISDLVLESAVVSLAAALVGTGLSLLFICWVIEGRPSLGFVNTFPVLVTVALVAARMRAVGISFTVFTATVLAITIGLGIDAPGGRVDGAVRPRHARDPRTRRRRGARASVRGG
jgi:predicted RND superfamily exporter protein